MTDLEVNEAVIEAAIALLHREIVAHGQVILTQEDFNNYESARGQVIQIDAGPDGAVIFTHTGLNVGQPVS